MAERVKGEHSTEDGCFVGLDREPRETGSVTSSSESFSFAFLDLFLAGAFVLSPCIFVINDYTSGMERVPLLSALNEALGLSTVCLNHPTS